MAGPTPPHFTYALLALGLGAGQRLREEWQASSACRWITSRPRPEGFGPQPRDFRPADAEAGRRILAGAFVLAGATLAIGPRGDPWDRPSPDRRFAEALHGFSWLRDLMAAGPDGAAEALRLILEWRRVFGRWNGFSWSPPVLERRVYNLACAARTVCVRASDAETALIAGDLARQARHLLDAGGGPARAAERACAAAVAGVALEGRAGERLLARALAALARALPAAVPESGGHATRSPQAALELLFDLRTLEDALVQRGEAPPQPLVTAVDRLAAAVRFFTLADGRLAAFQGGEGLAASYVAAARAHDEAGERPLPPSLGGYIRLEGRRLQLMADAAAPAAGAWSLAACAQPAAIEVLAGARRLIVGGGWSPAASGPPALRLVDAASTAALGEAPCGEPLRGLAAAVLGPRLADACRKVRAERQEGDGAVLVEIDHDGWVRRLGLRHERRLYLDAAADELRGEDRFVAVTSPKRAEGRRFIPFVVRFHLPPDVSALVARDKKSVLIKPEGEEMGWRLRNDALDVTLEPSTQHENGQPRRSQQIVLRGQARADTGARVRWKLSPARTRVDAENPAS